MARPVGQVKALLVTCRHRPLRSAGYACFAILLIALVVAGTVYYQRAAAADERDDSRAAALESARAATTALTNVDAKSVEASVRQLTEGSTGEFRKLFGQQAKSFRQVVRRDKVSSRGKVRDAALSRMDGDSAVALVAVESTVSNAASPKGQQRQYRFRLTMRQVSDRWLVSKLEFVS